MNVLWYLDFFFLVDLKIRTKYETAKMVENNQKNKERKSEKPIWPGGGEEGTE